MVINFGASRVFSVYANFAPIYTVRVRKIGSAMKILNFPKRSIDCLATDLHIKGKI